MAYVDFFFISLASILVPLFRDKGHFGWTHAKDRLFLLLSSLYLVSWLLSGECPAGEGPLFWLFLFAVMMAASILWGDVPHETLPEVARWGSLFVLAVAASRVPLELALFAVFLPAPLMAVYGLYNQFKKRDPLNKEGDDALIARPKRTSMRAWLGNSNYVAAYLVPCFFVGLHLVATKSLWWTVALIPIWLAIGWSHCRAGWASTIMGLTVLCGIFQPWLIAVAVVCFGAVVVICLPRIEPTIGRWFYLLAALQMLRKKPLFGWGAGAFRREYFRIQAEMNAKDPTILGNPKNQGRNTFPIGENAHNDHAETLVEVGIIGYALFLTWIITTIIGCKEPILLSGFVACVIHALLFFNLRMSGTAIPVFVLAGAIVGPSTGVILLPWPVSVIGTALLGALVYYQVIIPWRSARLYHTATMPEADQKTQIESLRGALALEPYRNTYLYRAAVVMAGVDPILSLLYVSRLLDHYDGEKIEWWTWDLYARCAFSVGSPYLAQRAFQNAIYLNPAFGPAYQGLSMANQAIKQIEGNKA